MMIVIIIMISLGFLTFLRLGMENVLKFLLVIRSTAHFLQVYPTSEGDPLAMARSSAPDPGVALTD